MGEEQKQKSITGYWTHLMRKSYIKWMESKGATPSLMQLKLRHKHTIALQHYTQADLNALLEWEAKAFT